MNRYQVRAIHSPNNAEAATSAALELKIERFAKCKDYTVGRLYVDGEYLCDTLEPTWRDFAHGARKLNGRSAIPDGRYPLVITWSKRFDAWLPLVVGVPGFSGIRIHVGNTASDSQGCILVGQNLKRGMVLNSRICLHRLMQKLDKREPGTPAFLTIG